MKGQEKIVLSELKGLFDRQDRPCPWDHFTDLKNLYWNGKGLTSRPPVTDDVVLPVAVGLVQD